MAGVIFGAGEAWLLHRGGLVPLSPNRKEPIEKWQVCWHTGPESLSGASKVEFPQPRVSALVGRRGKLFPLHPTLTVVGRERWCSLPLREEGIAPLHCVFLQGGRRTRILSLGGALVKVNGLGVQEGEVIPGAEITIGRRLFRASVGGARGVDALVPLPSSAHRRVGDLVERVAPSPAPVVLLGESGVGKEGWAHAVHQQSGRTGAFVALNAGALRPELASSELFGHREGAFTGAIKDHPGAFRAANGGTLFLDEVGELSLEVQAKLLRALEGGEIRSLGAMEVEAVEVRLVTATNRDLSARVRSGTFREDLFHRIYVLPIQIPPLRERPEDIVALTEAFLGAQDQPRTLTAAAWEKLLGYPWEGNIRELQNVLCHTCLVMDGTRIHATDLCLEKSGGTDIAFEDLIHHRVLREYLATGRSVSRTSRALGLHRSVVYRHLRRDRQLPSGGITS